MTDSHDSVASSSSESLDLPVELIRRFREDCEIRGFLQNRCEAISHLPKYSTGIFKSTIWTCLMSIAIYSEAFWSTCAMIEMLA